MTTLTEINVTLVSMRDEQKETTSAVQSLTSKISAQMEKQEMTRLKGLNTDASKSGAAGFLAKKNGNSDAGEQRGGLLSGKALGLGAGLGMMGAGALKGAAGLAAMGAAIPAFFGGLLAGSAGLSWLQDIQGMDYDGLKKAALGFSDIILAMDKQAFIVLGGIMGASAVGGAKGAAGLGFMGLAISGFLGGLLLGSEGLELAEILGADLNYGGLKKALSGFSSMIGSLSPEATIALAGIMGLGVVSSLKISKGADALKMAAGMTGIAAGIVGFLGGLTLGNSLLEGADYLGADLNFAALSKAFTGFNTMVGSLDGPAILALAGILGGAGAMAKFGAGPLTALNTAAIMTGIGAGISGLMIGLSAGDAGIGWIQKSSGIKSGGLQSMFKVFNDSIGELTDENAIKALGAIAAVGTAAGIVLSAGGAAAGIGIFGVMTGIGAGIAGLMIGLAAGDVGLSWIQKAKGTGDGITGIFKTFNDSILAITPAAIVRIKSLTELGGLDIAGALGGLTAGIVSFLGAEGLSKTFGMVGDTLKNGVDAIFGTNFAEQKRPGIVEQMLEGLKPLDEFDITKLDSFSAAMDRFKNSFGGLKDFDVSMSTANLTQMIADIGGVLGLLGPLINGGKVTDGTENWLSKTLGTGRGVIADFGGGLKALDISELDDLAIGVNAMRNALGGVSPLAPATEATVAAIAQQDVAIVKISDEVLNALTVALMQSDYQAEVGRSTAGGFVDQRVSTTNNIGGNTHGIILPPPGTNDPLDAGPR
jgi:hypothetical protein